MSAENEPGEGMLGPWGGETHDRVHQQRKGAGGEHGTARPYKKPLTLGSRFSFQYSQTTFIFRKSLPCRLISPPPGDLATKI